MAFGPSPRKVVRDQAACATGLIAQTQPNEGGRRFMSGNVMQPALTAPLRNVPPGEFARRCASCIGGQRYIARSSAVQR